MSETHSNGRRDGATHPPETIRLMREIRFSIDRDWATAAHGSEGFEGALPITNSWGGWPSAVGIAPYLKLRITVSGQLDPTTGYLVNIQQLDHLLRFQAIPLTATLLRECGVRLTGESLLRRVWGAVAGEIENGLSRRCRLERLQLWTTPYLSYGIQSGEMAMVELTQCFEFSASHRLHVPSMSDEENRRYFGKCNHPNGHGHNYQVEITVGRRSEDADEPVIGLPALEEIVRREVIDRMDHKHLNADVPEFATRNPSVENITRTIWDWLSGRFETAELRKVRVWETAKTFAEYSR